MRRAILFHELKHAAPTCHPRTGAQLEDERGRKLWRIRKHDLEEFVDVVEAFGTYKRDVENFYSAIVRHASEGFTSCGVCNPQGFVPVEGGGVRRCECWQAWQLRVQQGKREAVAS